MPHASGRSASLPWLAALCAVCACGGVQHPDVGPPAPAACVLGEPPLREADSAVVHFGAAATAREACALELIARELRPWPTSSNDRWAVRITLTEQGARAYRLSDEVARDVIDSGAALVATEDVAVLAYAAFRPDVEITRLPWDHTYFWLTPGAAGSLGATSLPDAVRTDARPAEVDPACVARVAGGRATQRRLSLVARGLRGRRPDGTRAGRADRRDHGRCDRCVAARRVRARHRPPRR